MPFKFGCSPDYDGFETDFKSVVKINQYTKIEYFL